MVIRVTVTESREAEPEAAPAQPRPVRVLVYCGPRGFFVER